MNKGRQPDFKLIKERVPIGMVLSHYGVLGRMKRRGNRLYGVCPIHGSGNNPTQFQVKLDKGLWYCFGDCHKGGSIIDLVSAMENVTVKRAAELISEWFESSENSLIFSPDTFKNRGNTNNKKKSPLHIRLKLEPEHTYLQKARGVSRETAELFGMGFCRHGMMAGRVAIPLHDEDGLLMGYCGRSVDGTGPKYLFPPGIKKGRILYNYHRAKEHLATTGLIVVEGFFDLFHLYQSAGLRNVVALMGSHASSYQLDMLCRASKVVLIMDGDRAGRAGGQEIGCALKDKAEIRVVLLPEGKEPENLKKAEIDEILRN